MSSSASPTLGFDHFAVRAYDFDATLRFYIDGLGFRLVYEWTAPGVVSRSAFLDAGDGSCLELFDAPTAGVPGGSPRAADDVPVPTDEQRGERAAVLHIALRTRDVDAAYAQAVAHGGRPLQEPGDLHQVGQGGFGDGTIRIAFVYGLDGEVVEFIDRADFTA